MGHWTQNWLGFWKYVKDETDVVGQTGNDEVGPLITTNFYNPQEGTDAKVIREKPKSPYSTEVIKYDHNRTRRR